MYNLNHLYYFFVTAKCGAITNAAKFLRIAQPALSMQLHTLESNLETKLFIKSGRGIVLSQEGQLVYGYCKKIFEAYDEFEDFMKKAPTAKEERVRIAISDEIERPFSSDIVSSMINAFEPKNQPRVTMVANDHKKIIELLQSREVDAIMTNYQPYDQSAKIQAEIKCPVHMCISKDYFPSNPSLKGEALRKYFSDSGLALPVMGQKLREETNNFLIKSRWENPVIFESDFLVAIKRAVLSSVGIGFLPEIFIKNELENNSIVKIGPEKGLWSYSIFLVTSSAVVEKRWLKVLREEFQRVQAGFELNTNVKALASTKRKSTERENILPTG
jgi:LysR family transcriptional activator of nhaA